MVDDLIHECEQFPTAHDICVYLRVKYGGTSLTKLRQLTIKLDIYKKFHNHNIKQLDRIMTMSNMVRELKSSDHLLSYEQQAQTLI